MVFNIFSETVAPCDRVSEMYNVSIPAYTTSFTYNIPITDDDVYEIDEIFKVRIVAPPSRSQVKRGQPYAATITVLDDEQRELFV